jgi:hypothetical protein
MYATLFDAFCRDTKALDPWKLMIGVMMSYKTLNELPSSWTPVWPKKEKVSDIFINHPRAYNTIHYADYDGPTTVEDLCRVREYGGPNLHAIQLDMIWPSPTMVKQFRERFPEIEIVLQVNQIAFNQKMNTPPLVVSQLAEYGDSINYVLFDRSHGHGLPVNAEMMRPFLRETQDWLPSLNLAVAGGLGPFSTHLIEPLLPEFPHLSIDAQGRLRPGGDAKFPIDKSLANLYLSKAVRLYKKYNTIP